MIVKQYETEKHLAGILFLLKWDALNEKKTASVMEAVLSIFSFRLYYSAG